MNQLRQPKFFSLLIPTLAILFIVAVQAFQFHTRTYRQDEAWVVHYAIENIANNGVLNHMMQVFRFVTPENVIQDVWVYAFGHIENVVRFLSTLYTILTLAIFYRLASDLFDKQTGRIAVFLLGTLSLFAFFTHEARPYAALALGTVGFQWALLRFIRYPNRTYATLTLLLGVIPFYQHPFLLYVFAAQVVCILLFVRWNRDLYLRGFALFVALGLLIGLRVIINFSERSGEILYATPTSIEAILPLYNEFKFDPEALGNFLFLTGLLVPTTQLKLQADKFGHKLRPFARKWWMIGALVLMIGLVMVVNAVSQNVTPRNLIIIAPYIALIAAYGLRHTPWQAQIIAILMFCIPFMTQFRYHNSNAGYAELASYMTGNYSADNGRIIMIAPQQWEWIPIKYYLDERTSLGLSNTDILYVSNQKGGRFVPQRPDESVMVRDFQSENFQQIRDHLGERDVLWVIKGNPFPLGNHIQNWIEDHFTKYDVVTFPGEGYYRALEVIEYHRQPESLETVVRFGDDIQLEGWTLNDSVAIQPCQTISLDTWWQTDTLSSTLYSSTLVIADDTGQGVANADDMPGGIYLTSQWEPEQLYFDERQLTIPCDIQLGQYNLLLGLYNIETVTNLPVRAPDGTPMGSNLLYLTTLIVE